MSTLNSTFTPKELEQIITPTPEVYPQQQLSPLTIGIIVISVVAGVGLIGLSLFLVRRRKRNRAQNGSSENTTEILAESPQFYSEKKRKKRVFSSSSEDIPVTTSSMDNNDLFFTILEYPSPTKPPDSSTSQLLQVPTGANAFLLHQQYDPISASLARQSIEERSGYYKSPTRTPIPYYQHQKRQSSSIPSSSSSAEDKSNTDLILVVEDDDDEKAMQRWSSSYQVW